MFREKDMIDLVNAFKALPKQVQKDILIFDMGSVLNPRKREENKAQLDELLKGDSNE